MKNDSSQLIKDWTTKKIKKEYQVYYDLINNPDYACYNTRDIIFLDSLEEELSKRKVYPKTKTYF